ncbi:uncharacterized protein LOC114350549 [Ostrinia furnacalis]|uniref:uncharacterized protein LOC114350549 n=1 Tax=Ostrinia furnacalis TaxID=93504 RepID=UPI00103F7F32|nr:uncharacterized protein LOC114350549 [Ostrinia furnacalis]
MSMKRDHPLNLYDDFVKGNPDFRDLDRKTIWTWDDSYVKRDFEKLKRPDVSITERLNNLKAFYLIYFGEISSMTNVGSLFVQLVATTPSIYDSSRRDLFEFDPKGERSLSTYKVPSNLEEVYKRFIDQSTTVDDSVSEEPDVEETPIEPLADGLVTEDQPLEGGGQDYGKTQPQLKETTVEDVKNFKAAVATAFLQLTAQEDTFTMDAYRSLHHTAFFLIMFMMRRITKRSDDLIAALSRANIHKHYTDMVQNSFGMIIPPPCGGLNGSLEQILSSAHQASRELYTIALWLLQVSTVGPSDQPVGLLDQQNVGLEAMLRATCMTHIAGSGLPLITLFVTLKTLFNKTERETLEWLSYPELLPSVRRIVSLRVSQCSLISSQKDVKLFPYCRLVNQNYHGDLGAKGNEMICYLMACLIDLKSPPTLGSGGARNAFWTSSLNAQDKSQIYEAARAMYAKVSHFKLTACFEGQVDFGQSHSTGNEWKHSHVPISNDDDDADSSGPIPIPLGDY